MDLDEFDYPLPERLIAQAPARERSASRLLVVGDELAECTMASFPALLRPDDCVVFNDARVIRARLRARKETGGAVELMLERLLDVHTALVQIRASKSPRTGARLFLDDGTLLIIGGRSGPFYRVSSEPAEIAALFRGFGELPLPPYIRRPADRHDEQRYQTVFARTDGAVAAPTAGLHFTDAMMASIRERGCDVTFVTLYVGAGTFQPIRSATVEGHVMHSERYAIDSACRDKVNAALDAGRRVVAVGTTTVRALESAFADGRVRSGARETALYIRPGFRFNVVSALLTNFHLPRSSLLVMVSAFAGIETVRRAYRHAVDREFRFFSYGDAMFLTRAGSGTGAAA